MFREFAPLWKKNHRESEKVWDAALGCVPHFFIGKKDTAWGKMPGIGEESCFFIEKYKNMFVFACPFSADSI